MKDIRNLFIFLVLILGFSCDDEERPSYTEDLGRFVRFAFAVNSDGEPFENGELNQGADYATEYDHRSFLTTVKIPVAITSAPLNSEVIVNFSGHVIGDYEGVNIVPEGVLSFNEKQLFDTIYIMFNERWSTASDNQIVLTLESVSDPEVSIGNQYTIDKNDVFTINLKDILMRYSFQSDNELKVLGEQGESVSFNVDFLDGLLKSELDTINLITIDSADFEFDLVQQPFQDGDTKISYVLTLLNNIQVDELEFTSKLNLNQVDNYTLTGNTFLRISKDKVNDAENSVNTAVNFYNLDDPYNRTYGVNWMDFTDDGECEWRSFNTFTVPVKVDAEHPNAVLDNKGTADISDDEYYHAFRIGFVSVNEGNTTNPFNLKRWFNNESTDADVSPGFNIAEALEFFPLNDTSTTEGTVEVIQQDLVISAAESAGGNIYTISIEGEGTYEKISDELFEISLELKATNNELFGGTRTSKYKIYNKNNYTDPEGLSDDCFVPIDL